eukprot:CFRG6008T1
MPSFSDFSRRSFKRPEMSTFEPSSCDEQRIESTLIKWTNHFLSQGEDAAPKSISNITTDLNDGVVFCVLLTMLGDIPIKFNQKPKNKFQMVDNVKIALAAMNDIFGNAYWEVNDVRNGDRTTNVEILMTVIKKTQVLATVKNPLVRRGNISDTKAADLLTTWVNKSTKPHNETLESWEYSFRDGRLLSALIHHFHPHLIDLDSLKKGEGLENNEIALTTAEWCGIPKLVDAQYITTNVDTFSLVIYVAFCHKILSTGQSDKNLIKIGKEAPGSETVVDTTSAPKSDTTRSPLSNHSDNQATPTPTSTDTQASPTLSGDNESIENTNVRQATPHVCMRMCDKDTSCPNAGDEGLVVRKNTQALKTKHKRNAPPPPNRNRKDTDKTVADQHQEEEIDVIEEVMLGEFDQESKYLIIENDRLSTAITFKRKVIFEEMKAENKKMSEETARWEDEGRGLLEKKQTILEKIKALEQYIATKGLMVPSLIKPTCMLQDMGGVVLTATALSLKMPHVTKNCISIAKSPLNARKHQHQRTVSNAVIEATAEVLASDEDKVKGITKFQRIVRSYLKGSTRKDNRIELESALNQLMELQNYTAAAARRITEEVHAMIPQTERKAEMSTADLRVPTPKGFKGSKTHLNLNKNIQTLLSNSPSSLRRNHSVTSVGSKQTSGCVPASLENNKLREIVNHCQDFAGFHEELADDMRSTLAEERKSEFPLLFLERMDHFKGKHLNYVRLVFCAMYIEMWKLSLSTECDDGQKGLRRFWDNSDSEEDVGGYEAPLRRLSEYHGLLRRLSELSSGDEAAAYREAAKDMRLALVEIHSERRRELNRMQLVYINWLFGLSGQSGNKKETLVSSKRWFLGYGDVTEIDHTATGGGDKDNKPKRGTRTFLFNDMIIMCRKKERIFTNLSKEKRYRIEKTFTMGKDFRVVYVAGYGNGSSTAIRLSGLYSGGESILTAPGTGTEATGTFVVKGRCEGRRWVRMLETVSNARRHASTSKHLECSIHHGMGQIYMQTTGWTHSYVALTEKSLYVYQAPEIGDVSCILQPLLVLPVETLSEVYTMDNPPSGSLTDTPTPSPFTFTSNENMIETNVSGWTRLLATTPLPPGGWFNAPAGLCDVPDTLMPKAQHEIDSLPTALKNANTTNYVDNLIYGLETAYVPPEDEAAPKNEITPDISNPTDSAQVLNPAFFVACCNFLTKHGLTSEGIFRIPGNGRRVKTLQTLCASCDFGTPAISPEEYSVNDVATALKLYLRELPTSLLGNVYYHRIMNITMMPVEHQTRAIRLFMHKLPSGHREILKLLLNLLEKIIDNSSANMMDKNNLVVCLAPSLLWDHAQRNNQSSSGDKTPASEKYSSASQTSIVRTAQEAAGDIDAIAYMVGQIIDIRHDLFYPLPDVYHALEQMDAQTLALKKSYGAVTGDDKALASYKSATCASVGKGGKCPQNAESLFLISTSAPEVDNVLFVTEGAEWDEWNHQFSVLLS